MAKKMKMLPGMHEPWAREAGLYKGFTVWEEILGNREKSHLMQVHTKPSCWHSCLRGQQICIPMLKSRMVKSMWTPEYNILQSFYGLL